MVDLNVSQYIFYFRRLFCTAEKQWVLLMHNQAGVLLTKLQFPGVYVGNGWAWNQAEVGWVDVCTCT